MIYFDNAATTFPKPKCVYRSVIECIKTYCGNPGRSSHALSVRSEEEIYRAREAVASFLNIKNPEYVVFTENATHALNIAIKTAIPDNSHVIISNIEHNSVLRPLSALAKSKGVTFSVFSVGGDVEKEISSLIQDNTSAVICSLMSNVNGHLTDMKLISDICHRNSLLFIADASQKIGHFNIDLANTPCDILCAPAHKALFGIQGAGFAVMCDGKVRESFMEGGGGSESMNISMPEYLPDRYEAGTLPTPSIVSLRSGIDFINSIGLGNIADHINKLTAYATEILISHKKTSFLSGEGGVISFNIGSVPASECAAFFDKNGICTRAGLHCAPLAHKMLSTENDGTVRISFSYFNTLSEIDTFYKVLKDM